MVDKYVLEMLFSDVSVIHMANLVCSLRVLIIYKWLLGRAYVMAVSKHAAAAEAAGGLREEDGCVLPQGGLASPPR